MPLGHSYELSDFNKGVAVFSCVRCEEKYNEHFEDYLNKTDYAPFDVNNDGIINGKDYAYLKQDFTDKE